MTVDTSLAIVGILIGVIFGVAAFFMAKSVRSRRINQSQKVGDGGVGIQSGRDTKLGSDG